MKKSELTAAAKELNKVLGLEPPIDVTQEIAKVRKLVKEAGTLIEPTDSFSVGTTKVLEELKVVVPAPAAKKAAAPVAKALDEPVNDDEGAEELEVVIEEPSPEAKAKSKAKAAPKKAEKAPKAITRLAAAARVLFNHKGDTVAIDTIIDEADDLYGTSNRKEANQMTRQAITVLAEWGALTVADNQVTVGK
ncbi:MAG: hypothetical protein WC992_06995 [Acholeplasmataceae bacterium]